MAATKSADRNNDAGGTLDCRRLAEVFYRRAAKDPVLGPFFPGSLRCAIEGLTAYLTQLLGGPSEYSERRWSLSLREAHQRFKIGEREREAWLRNMDHALDEVKFDGPARAALQAVFEQYSTYIIDADSAPHQCASEVQHEIARRGRHEFIVEEAVRAVRRLDSVRAIELAESADLAEHFQRDRGALLSLLALMSGTGEAAMLRYVHDKILNDPAMAVDRYTYGRTLLHDAAAEGSLPTVRLLLRLKADPNAIDQFGHTPLYFAANQCSNQSGAAIVRLLANAGADTNIRDRAKRCTALHMAARRGNVEITEALLDCGADLEISDSQGDTALRRAVNCSKPEVVRLLLQRGADPYSIGSKGLTPIEAARRPAMRQLFDQ